MAIPAVAKKTGFIALVALGTYVVAGVIGGYARASTNATAQKVGAYLP